MKRRLIAALLGMLLALGVLGLSAPVRAQEDVPWNYCAMGFDLLLEAAEKDARLQEPLLIAVMDSGCDMDHSAFEGRISPKSKSFMGDGKGIADDTGHGTAVASVIANATPPSVQLLILKVCGANGYASGEAFNEALCYAMDQGAAAVNISIRVLSPDLYVQNACSWQEGVDACWAAGIPVVCGAGNDAADTAYCFPAADPCAITVSALSPYGDAVPNSNYGSEVDFCAPGQDIAVATVGTGNGYHTASGTSLAAPHITASLAYCKLLHPKATVRQMVHALASCAMDLGDDGRDVRFGEGMPEISDYILGRRPKDGFPQVRSMILQSATPGFAGEEAENLFLNKDRKWCVLIGQGVYVEWEQTTPLAPSAIILVTANDNAQYPGRNPAGAKLYGRNGAEEAWQLLWTQPSYHTMADDNYHPYRFPMDKPGTSYRFFRLEIPTTTGSNVLQLSRVELE